MLQDVKQPCTVCGRHAQRENSYGMAFGHPNRDWLICMKCATEISLTLSEILAYDVYAKRVMAQILSDLESE